MEFQPQRDAFCNSYGVPQPQLPLRDLAHWDAVLKQAQANNADLHAEHAYVAPGYFYMPVTDEPDERRLAELVDLASGADWLLVPSLLRTRREGGSGAIAVPFMQAAYFRSSGRVDFTLREAVGDRQYKAIIRYTTKAEAACNTEIRRLADLADNRALDDFAGLQAMNGAKYGHARNLYTRDVLQMLARSDEGSKYYLKLDYEKNSNTPLCGSLSYADDKRGVFTKLVVGLDRDHVPAGLNLLITDKYKMYRFADQLGFSDICLGRGAIESKLRVGANHVVELDNWLIPINTRRTRAMHEYAMQGGTQ